MVQLGKRAVWTDDLGTGREEAVPAEGELSVSRTRRRLSSENLIWRARLFGVPSQDLSRCTLLCDHRSTQWLVCHKPMVAFGYTPLEETEMYLEWLMLSVQRQNLIRVQAPSFFDNPAGQNTRMTRN